MKDIITENHIIKFNHTEYTGNIEFNVYPVCHYRMGDKKGIEYYDKKTSQCEIEEFNEDTCLREMSGFVCWRGCWDERVYFDDGNEYTNLTEIAELYKTKIVPVCRKEIQKIHQHITTEEMEEAA